MAFEREGERPRESPSFGIRSDQAKLGSREDARPPNLRVPSVFYPLLKNRRCRSRPTERGCVADQA